MFDPTAIVTLGGLIMPPVFDLIKKIFVSKNDTASATLNTLAITKPEVIADYTKGQAALVDAQTKYYNRDMPNPKKVSQWILDLRASIRPIYVVISILLVACCVLFGFHMDQSFKELCAGTISFWFGNRFTV
ncbi:MAG: hypothetical protein P9X22_08920 [Candidatus Zapsychrus exili]|nr:hypothetical protein [Candidatus Zapsychrus exili]